MRLPRTRASKLASAALAGVIALSTLVGPALVPSDMGGSVAQAEVTVDIGVFQNALSPYGRWVDSPQYGQVWYPTNVRQGWRPYYDDGHWAYSDDDGWVWVSDAPWGWAPFHYGRWAFDPNYGWIWVPGRVWGPAWVTFRQDNDAIGWAPLPPDAGWDPGYGYRDPGINISINFWSFVRPEGVTARHFDRYAFDRRQYPTIINRTTNITNITVINNRIVNNSIRVDDIERVTHQRVERLKVTESDRPDRTVIKGNNVVFYKPTIVERGDATQAHTQAAALTKENPQADNKKRFIKAGNASLEQSNQPAGQGNAVQTLDKKNQQKLQPLNNGGNNATLVQPGTNTKQKQQLQQLNNGGQTGNLQPQPQVNLKKKQPQPQFQQLNNGVGQTGNAGQPQVNLKKKQQQFNNGVGQNNTFAQPQANLKTKQPPQQFNGGQNGNGQPQVNLKKKQQQQQYQQFNVGNGGQPQVQMKQSRQTQQLQQQPRQQKDQGQPSYKKECGGSGQPACQ